jgi:hypothetical protein
MVWVNDTNRATAACIMSLKNLNTDANSRNDG